MRIVSTIICKIVFCNICSVNNRFLSEQIVCSHPCFLILILQFHSDGHFAVFQPFLDLLKEIKLFCSFFVHTGSLGNLCNSSLQDLKIRENELQVDSLNITDRVDASIYVNYIGILKTAYYMNDCINFTDVCKELVSKTFSLRSALYKSCNVNKFYNGRCHFLGMIKITKQCKSFIRHSNNSHIRVNGTEGIVRRFCTSLCQGIKKCTFSYIWKSNDT